MPLSLMKKRSIYLILITILILLAFIGFYFLYLVPMKNQVQSIKAELNNELKLVDMLESGDNQINPTIEIDTAKLQRKLPVKPIVDQFLLDLEKAEVVSNSLITSMTFGDGNVEPENLVDQLNQQQDQELDNGQELPTGIEKITVNLTVESSNYEELEKFIQALEKLERITKIEQIAFSGYEEEISDQHLDEKLVYEVVVSTFYFPSLTELVDQLPKIDVPNPSNKTNPLLPIQEKPNQNDHEIDEDVQPANAEKTDEQSYQIIHHKVGANDTLYSISMKYYHSRAGEQLIKSKNKLAGNKVYIGQILEIPISK